MLVLSEAISGRNIMSLHAGGAIAKLGEPIIDPTSLKIIGFGVSAPGMKFFSVLHTSDIREWSALGIIVNSEDVIMEVDENMPKIRELVEANFVLSGIGVRTESGKRLGKVKNFVFETEGFFVVKFYVEKIGLFDLMKSPLIIERDSIINVTKKFLVISDDASNVKVNSKNKKEQTNVEYGFSG